MNLMKRLFYFLLLLIALVVVAEVFYYVILPITPLSQSTKTTTAPQKTKKQIPWQPSRLAYKTDDQYGKIYSVTAKIEKITNPTQLQVKTGENELLNVTLTPRTEYMSRVLQNGLPYDFVEKKPFPLTSGQIVLVEWLESENANNNSYINVWRIVRFKNP